ncbi:hypothetical protein FDP41_004437 [Naegleria fowleri]|uniref:BTB domain-containing protein n=1 Tax=Naegleria fowleri TaxID=5763 RepID=A0A6A5BQN4_NAEFO|nr:uncharacterized protein FDP41_004437 [Naegleria fowleri]KAF0976538.1 hypothetical protein FDP41_004437 [Naegleria fowleri]CAG4709652.1 unnamed protein product [Naegleria fowleri]
MSKYKKYSSESSSSDDEDEYYKKSGEVSSDNSKEPSKISTVGAHQFGCEKTSDTVLKITQMADEPFKLYCHKTCLGANSPYLKSKIEELPINDQHETTVDKPILILNDLDRYDKRVITMVVKHLHDSNTIEFDQPILCLEDVITIVKIAILFGMEQLASRAKTALLEEVGSHNFFQLYILAKSYALDQILDELKRWMTSSRPTPNFHTSSHLMRMSEFMLMDFITEMSTVNGSVAYVFMSVLAWCRVNVLDVKKLRKVLSTLCENTNDAEVRNTVFAFVFPVWKKFLKDDVSLSDEAFLCMYHSLLSNSFDH